MLLRFKGETREPELVIVGLDLPFEVFPGESRLLIYESNIKMLGKQSKVGQFFGGFSNSPIIVSASLDSPLPGFISQRLSSENRLKTASTGAKQVEIRTPTQQENVPNGFNNRSTTPPSESLPPTKFSTIFRKRTENNRRRALMEQAKTPKQKGSDTSSRFAPPKSAVKEQEVVFHESTPLSMGDGDLNDSAWAMMGESSDFDFVGTGMADEDGIALMNTSILSLDDFHDDGFLAPKTPGRAVGDTPQMFYDKWKNGSPSRLVGSSRAKKKDSASANASEKDAPFNTFRQNSTHMALDETGAYVAKIQELMEQLKAEKAKNAQTQSNMNHSYQTPAPFRGVSASTPPSTMKSMDPESLYERNQTLAKEVRFAEQTCIEVSGKNESLEKKVLELQAQVETLQKEKQTLQDRATTAESLEASWKSRITELESMLTTSEKEKSKAVEKCRELETRCVEVQQQAENENYMASDREGKLMQAILAKEDLAKELKAAREKYTHAEQQLKSLANRYTEQADRLQILQLENEHLLASQEKQEKNFTEKLEDEKGNNVSLIQHLKGEIERLSQQRSDRESQLEKELQDARNAAADLRAQLLQVQKKEDQQTNEASESALLERQHLSAQLHDFESELYKKDASLRETHSKLHDTSTQLTRMTKLRDDAAEKLEDERDEFTKEVSKLSLEVESLRHDMQESENKRFALEDERRTILESLAESLQEKEAALRDVEYFRQLSDSLEEKMQEGGKESDRLRQVVQQCKSNLEATEKEADTLRGLLEEYKVTTSELKEEVRSLRTSAENTESTKEVAVKEVESLKQSLAQAESQIKLVEENLELSKDRCSRLQQNNGAAQGELDSLRRSVGESENAKAEMQRDLEMLQKDLKELKKEHKAELEAREKLYEDMQNELCKAKQIAQRHGEAATNQNADIETLRGTIQSKQGEVDWLSKQLDQTKSQLAETVQKCRYLEYFKSHATASMQKLPAQLDAFCVKMEDLINSRTVDMNDRIEGIAQLASILRGTIVFEEEELEPPGENVTTRNRPRDFLDTYSQSAASIDNRQPRDSASFTSSLDHNGKTKSISPTRTINLELMEEARGGEQQTADAAGTPHRDFEVADAFVDSQASESLSSIADISHLFSEEDTLQSPHRLPSERGGAEMEGGFSRQTMLGQQSMAESIRESKLERESLKASLDNVAQDNRDLQAEKLEIQEELESLRNSSGSQIVQLQNERSLISSDLVERTSEVEQLKAKLQETESRQNELSEKLARTQSEVETKDREIELLTELQQALKGEKQDLEGKVDALKREVDENKSAAKSALDKQQGELEILRKANSELEEKSRRLQGDIDLANEAADMEKNQLADVLRQTKEELNETKESYRDLLQKWEDLKETATGEKVEMEAKLNKKQRDLERVVCLHQEAEGKIRDLQDSILNLEAETKEKVDKAALETERLAKLCENSDAEKREMRDKLYALDEEHEAEKGRLASDLAAATERLKERDANIKKYRDEKSKATKNSERIQSEHSRLNETIDKLAEDRNVSRMEITLLQERCDEKDIQIKNIRSNLRASEKRNKELSGELETLNLDNNSLRSANKVNTDRIFGVLVTVCKHSRFFFTGRGFSNETFTSSGTDIEGLSCGKGPAHGRSAVFTRPGIET